MRHLEAAIHSASASAPLAVEGSRTQCGHRAMKCTCRQGRCSSRLLAVYSRRARRAMWEFRGFRTSKCGRLPRAALLVLKRNVSVALIDIPGGELLQRSVLRSTRSAEVRDDGRRLRGRLRAGVFEWRGHATASLVLRLRGRRRRRHCQTARQRNRSRPLFKVIVLPLVWLLGSTRPKGGSTFR